MQFNCFVADSDWKSLTDATAYHDTVLRYA